MKRMNNFVLVLTNISRPILWGLLTAAFLFSIYIGSQPATQAVNAYRNIAEGCTTADFFIKDPDVLSKSPNSSHPVVLTTAPVSEPATAGMEQNSDAVQSEAAVLEEQVIIPAENPFKVVAYYPYWTYNQIGKVQFDIVTHAVYAFAIPKHDGTLKPLENPKSAEELISAAHAAGKKVLLGVGGWYDNGVLLEPVFKDATSTPEKISRFADEIVKMCNDYGFDGVDIDWEYPRSNDGSWQQYESLMVLLGEKLHSQGKLLTAAVLLGVYPAGYPSVHAAAQTDTVLNTVDWINIMAYDGDNGAGHSPYDQSIAGAEYWLKTRALPPEKVVLGVPFYARPSGVSYESILNAKPDAAYSDTLWINGRQHWFNGINTIKQKTQYAKENIGGIMIWEITHDTSDKSKSLLTAIGEVIK